MTPRFLIDACLPRILATRAGIDCGFDSVHVVDCLGDGAADDDVIAFAIKETRIVVTADVGDFSKLARTPGLPGTVLVDQADTPSKTMDLALDGMREAAKQLWAGKTLTQRLIRVRRNGRIVTR